MADPWDQRDLDQLAEWAQKAERAESAETLLGLEGMAAKVYFAGLARTLKGGEAFNLSGTTFDRFGIVTSWIDGNSQNVYLDDITYTCAQK